MQNTYQYNDHFSFWLPYCWKFRKCNKPTKKKKRKETISISTSLKIWVVTTEGLKEDFWGAGTVSLLDLSTGDERCIHFVKTDLAAHFVMLPQKINKNLYSFHQSCSVDGLEYLFGGNRYYLQKERMPLSPHLEQLYLIPWIGSNFQKYDQQSGDRGTVGFAWFSGGHFLRFQH